MLETCSHQEKNENKINNEDYVDAHFMLISWLANRDLYVKHQNLIYSPPAERFEPFTQINSWHLQNTIHTIDNTLLFYMLVLKCKTFLPLKSTFLFPHKVIHTVLFCRVKFLLNLQRPAASTRNAVVFHLVFLHHWDPGDPLMTFKPFCINDQLLHFTGTRFHFN